MLRGSRLLILVIVFAVVIQGFSQPVSALEFHVDNLNLELRDFFRAKVEKSDLFIDNINEKADRIVNNSIGSVSFYTRQGFSTLETFTGLSEQNQLYSFSKNNWQKTIGLGLGVIKGTKDFATGTVFLLAYLESSPARTITLAYNVKERPREYKEKAISGGKTVAGILANAGPLVGGIYQWGKSTYVEAQKDPLRLGQLQGEVGVFGASFFVGGGQLKAIGAANKAQKTGKAGGIFVDAAKTGREASRVDKAGRFTNKLPNLNGFTAKIYGSSILEKATELIKRIERINFGAYLPGLRVTNMAFSGKPPTIVPLQSSVAMKSVAQNRYTRVKYPYNEVILQKEQLVEVYGLPQTTRRQILDWADYKYEKWLTRLTPEQLDVIKIYTGNSHRINRILRGQTEVPITFRERRGMEQLPYVLDTAPILDENIVVFRGGSTSLLGDLVNLPLEEYSGRVLLDKGFMSTSILPSQARFFADEVFEIIRVPAGTKGAYLGRRSILPEEYEFLLYKGQQKKVLDAVEGSDGIIILDLQVL
jgi:hypothetical protein